MARLKDFYHDTVAKQLKEQFGYRNDMQIPRITKVTLNMGVGEAVADRKVMDHADDIARVESYWMDDAEIAVIAYGFTARAAYHAVQSFRERGKKVGMIRLITIWPFPEKAITELIGNVKHILIPEMNLGQVAHEVERLINVPVIRLAQVNGEVMTPAPILEILKEMVS